MVEAVHDLTRALRLKPDFAAAYYQRGEAFFAAGRFPQAIVEFGEAIRCNSKLVEAHCSRGKALAQVRQFHKALIELTKAVGGVRFDRGFAAALDCRGKIYYNLGRFHLAAADFSHVLRLKPAGVPRERTLFRRAMAYVQLEDFAAAQSDLDAALQLRPNYKMAREASQWLRAGRVGPLTGLELSPVVVPPEVPPIIRTPHLTFEADPTWETIELWDQWIVASRDKHEYGPVTKAEMDQWYMDGRIDDTFCAVRIDMNQWIWIGEVYIDLGLASHRAHNRPIVVRTQLEQQADELPVIEPWPSDGSWVGQDASAGTTEMSNDSESDQALPHVDRQQDDQDQSEGEFLPRIQT
jgi:tetratricopeptide (TPR) repeat protein